MKAYLTPLNENQDMNCVQPVTMKGTFKQNKQLLLSMASSMATTMQNLLPASVITVLVQNPRQHAGDSGEGIVALPDGRFMDGATGELLDL
jgi:hypothetical protein